MSKIATFTVSLTPAPTVAASVGYTTANETAASPADYTPASGTLTFAPGQTSQTVTVPLLASTTAAVAKAFRLVLSNPVNCTLPGTLSGECVISTAAGGTGTTGGTTGGTGGTTGTTPVLPGLDVAGPLIKNGLITNAYNNEYGRGGYFHPASGTSEGQSIMISAGFLANQALAGGSAAEVAAGAWLGNLSLTMLDALGNGSLTGPMLRQPIPTDPNTICMLHWLFAARGAIPSQAIAYDFAASPVAGKLRIPAGSHGADVYRVWIIYPATSELLYSSPYSPAYDIANAGNETQIYIGAADWSLDAATNDVVITIPAGAPAGVASWKICYGYQKAGIIPQGAAQEAYPDWALLPDGYVSCAPDTFRWFEQALTLAIGNDARPGKADAWTKLRAASRRTAVRGQSLTDKREVLKAMPGFDAIPASGDPSGMFCYSNHPAALPPANPGLNQNWIGYAFWSRATNGDILGTVPNSASVAQVQLGRGFSDSWRPATPYQDPDQFLYVSLSCTKKPVAANNEHFYVYVSQTKAYSAEHRYYADIGPYASFATVTQAQMDAGQIYEFLIPITDFRRKDFDNLQMTVGTLFQNFGISAEMSGAYNIRLRDMRMISGVSTDAVMANYRFAAKGGQLPFFPGAMPFDISADTVRQSFVGYSGNPFHGYQLPDLWYYLGADADAVHPNLAVADLPTADPATGAVVHVMSLTTAGGAAKPGHALLMEQQLRFLQAAQNRYHADGGPLGPFAHTFVLNTPDRANIGNPTPGTWVYTNDDPNTRWIGYQCRVVESLATLLALCGTQAAFADCAAIAKPMVVNFLTWLNGAWPNLNGISYTDTTVAPPAAKLLKGMPSEYDDPAKMPVPVTDYDEPHGPALMIRAALRLKELDGSQAVLCDALVARSWTYMELLYVTAPGELQYTWSPDPARLQWYGFWNGEIITTICLMIQKASLLPAGIAVATLKLRLVQNQGWLAGTGVKTGA